MRHLSTPCLFDNHDRCPGQFADAYGDMIRPCACLCHYAISDKRQDDEPATILFPLPGTLQLLLLVALACLLYFALCALSSVAANAATLLLSH